MNPEKLTAMINQFSQRLADTEMQRASALADAQLEKKRADVTEARVKELEAAAEKSATVEPDAKAPAEPKRKP